MSGTDELRESILFMWHGATTNLWNSRLIMLLDPDFFFWHVSQATVCQGGAEMYSGKCCGAV